MTTATREAVKVDLGGCSRAHCLEMGWNLKHQLDPGYSKGAAVLELADSFQVYETDHRTARKRAAFAGRAGYQFHYVDRQIYADDIHAVNTSMPERQGRPMSAGYLEEPVYGPNPVVCVRHHVYTYAVIDPSDFLVAYLWLYRCGDLALVSSILGHADHLHNHVVYQLFVRMVAEQYQLGGAVMYNLWDSGQDGLRFFKERVGLEPRNIEWSLA